MKKLFKKVLSGILALSMLSSVSTALAANTIEVTGITVLEGQNGEAVPVATYAPNAQDVTLNHEQMLEVTLKVENEEDAAVSDVYTSFLSYLSSVDSGEKALGNDTVQYAAQKTTNSDGTVTVRFRPRESVGAGLFVAKSGATDAAAAASFKYTVTETLKTMTLTGRKHSLADNSTEDATFVITAEEFTGEDYKGFNVYLGESTTALESTNYKIEKADNELVLTIYNSNFAANVSGNKIAVKLTHDGYDDAINEIVITPAVYNVTLDLNDGTISEGTNVTSYTQGTAVKLPTLTKEHYTFDGWCETEACTDTPVTEIPTSAAGDKKYYAKWTPVKYPITFVNENGDELQKLQVSYGETPVYSGTVVPTKAEDEKYTYTFNNEWNPPLAAVEGPATYTAVYTANPKKYTVTLDLNYNGSVAETTEYTYKNGLAELPDPTTTRDHYTFEGWYTDRACTAGNEFTGISTEDFGAKTYYAKWTPDTYQITYELNGGEFVEESPEGYAYTYNEVYTLLTDADVSYDGYYFDGWYANQECSGDAVKVIPAGETGAKTFYAKWTTNAPTSYVITFINHDGTILQNDPVNVGETPVYNGATPTKAEDDKYTYEFVGWNSTLIPVTGSATYKAEYTANPKKYTVTLNLNYDGSVAETTEYTYKEGLAELPNPETTREGYTFEGWYTDAACTPGNKVTAISAEDFGAKTYYAKWTINQYTITFKNGDETTTVKVNHGERPEYEGTPTKAEDDKYTYTFEKWTPELAEATGNATYEAQYTQTPREYTVTLNPNEGVIADGEDVTSYKYGTAVKLPVPTRENYTFAGWYDSEDKKVEEISADTTGNKTYTAKWTINQYTITFKNGDETTTVKVNHGERPEYEGTPTKAEDDKYTYTFEKWTPELVEATGNATYEAQYTQTPRKYTVTLNPNEGVIADGEDVISYTYGTVVKLPVPTRENYTFAGWYENENLEGTAVTEISADATGNKTYTAKWTQNDVKVTLDVYDEFENVLTVEQLTEASGNTTITATAKENATLPTLVMYQAIYANGVLKSVTELPDTASEDGGKIDFTFTAPQLEDGESYKLMLWTDEQEPVIDAITSK